MSIERTFAAIHDRIRSNDGLEPVEALDAFLAILNGQSSEVLSPRTHRAIEGLLEGVALDGLDARAVALRTFLDGAQRKGLGIYPTPDAVARAVIRALGLDARSRVLDPACGTGTFLLHTASAHPDAALFGAERSPRLARLATLASEGPIRCGNSLDVLGEPAWFDAGSFDAIVCNPPFGVEVDAAALVGFTVANGEARFPSEMAFVERCLDLLRPGGRLGVVLPHSVLSNTRLGAAREALDRKGRLLAVLALPVETFAITGTWTRTAVAFFEKRGAPDSGVTAGSVLSIRSENVGYDASGRPRAGSDLEAVADELRGVLWGGDVPRVGELVTTPAGEELAGYASAVAGPAGEGVPLAELALVRLGRTPPRTAWAEGARILKVGHLTGAGLDWSPRDRDQVSNDYLARIRAGRARDGLLLRAGDILLTSTAHRARYIAKKADIVAGVPGGGPVTYSGELMLVRATEIEPYRLLAWLRLPATQEALRARVRGQTAHLMPREVREMVVPRWVFDDPGLGEVAALLERQATEALQSWALRQAIDGQLARLSER